MLRLNVIYKILLTTLLNILFLSSPASAKVNTTYSEINLITDYSSLPIDGGIMTVGISLETIEGWHSYWKNPGDAGGPLVPNWTMPEGFMAEELKFPSPQAFELGGFMTYGYAKPIILLSDVTVPEGLKAGETYNIKLQADWLVCDESNCVPESAQLSLDLRASEQPVYSTYAEAINLAKADVPQNVTWKSLFESSEERLSVGVKTPSHMRDATDIYLFPEVEKQVEYTEQAVAVSEDGILISMDRKAGSAGITRFPALLQYRDNDDKRLKTVRIIPQKTEQGGIASLIGSSGLPSQNNPPTFGFFKILSVMLSAFLGGIILNLMPCVFPILSLKALSLVKLANADYRKSVESGIFYTLGILLAFLGIATILLSLRFGGHFVGWGFQMQYPIVSIILGLLMVAVALNLFGVFEIGTSITGVGQSHTQGDDRKSAFFTGLLAVLVATPCTAPFMSAAMGVALTQPAFVSLSIIMCVGLGLAFPYLLISLFPNIGRILPKPGLWMITFRKILAFPLLATTIWLFYVAGQQTSIAVFTNVLVAALVLSFGLWCYGQIVSSKRKVIWSCVAIISLCVTVFIVTRPYDVANVDKSYQANASSQGSGGPSSSVIFEAQDLKRRVANGENVFLYFTADWCISCKVNERTTLSTQKVADLFQSRNITTMIGDWTVKDAEITSWLEKNGRVGVPLYLYYKGGSDIDTPVILPQILTASIVDEYTQDFKTGSKLQERLSEKADKKFEGLSRAEKIEVFDESVALLSSWRRKRFQVMKDIRAANDSDNFDPNSLSFHKQVETLIGTYPDTDIIYELAEDILAEDKRDALDLKVLSRLINIKEDRNQPEPYKSRLRKYLNEVQERFRTDEALIKDAYILQRWSVAVDPDPEINQMREEVLTSIMQGDGSAWLRGNAAYILGTLRLKQASHYTSSPPLREQSRLKAIEIAKGLQENYANQPERIHSDFLGTIALPDEKASRLEDIGKYIETVATLASIGRSLPDNVFKDRAGQEFSLSDYRGRLTLIDFWADWCKPCVASFPKLKAMREEYGSDRFEIIGFNTNEVRKDMDTFLSNNNYDWPQTYVGATHNVIYDWMVDGLPTYILIDENGTIIYRGYNQGETSLYDVIERNLELSSEDQTDK